MLSNYPKVLKYAVGDRPWTFSNTYHNISYGTLNNNGWNSGHCRRVKVIGWETIVTTANNDGVTAVQTNYYTVKEIIGYGNFVQGQTTHIELYDTKEFVVPESKLFSSRNHLLSFVKGKYLNSSFPGLTENGSSIFKNLGQKGGQAVANGDWIDWAGVSFKDVNFRLIDGLDFLFNAVWVGTAGEQTAYVGGELGGTKTLIIDNCTFAILIYTITQQK